VRLLRLLTDRLGDLEARLEESTLRDVPSRVAAALVRTWEQQGDRIRITHQELAGATEEELRASGTAYKVGRHEIAHTGMGMALAEPGLAKVIASPDNVILGCHIIGPDASVLIYEAVVAMTTAGRLEAITDAVHAHPAGSQLLEDAARAALVAPVEGAASGDV
jgi:hypothetical protein